MIAFRCSLISCTIFMLFFFFLHSCYVNVFHWFSVSSLSNTICLFEYIMIIFDMHMIAFRCNLISCTIFMLLFFFLHSCYVNVFCWFSVSSLCNTICLFENKPGLYWKNIHFIHSCG